MHALLNDIALHPNWVLLVVFLVAFSESIVLVGTLVPAGVVLFTAGALIGTGAVNVWATLGIAAIGAVCGDGLSYEVGRKYYEQIKTWGLFQRRTALVERGQQFIREHGGKSILFARFIAPVRAIVPFIAGIAHMRRTEFYFANIGSALVWSPAHILPGLVFGASIQLARAVSGRIALILILLVALIWLVAWVTRMAIRNGIPILRKWRDGALLWANQTAPTPPSRTRLWVSMLLDPHKPGSHALLLCTLLFVGSSVLFLIIAQDVFTHDSLVHLDMALFNMLQGLRTWPADHLMVGITELGGVRVRLFVALAVMCWLVLRRCWRTAGYWLAMTIIAEGLVRLLALITNRPRPLNLYSGIEHFSFPSGHATSSMIIYGFLAYLVARRQTPINRAAITVITTVGIVLIGISRLYLGAHWLSDVLAGWSLGVAWLTLAVIIYTQRQVSERLHPRALGGLALAVLLASGAWTFIYRSDSDLSLYTPESRTQTITLTQWTDSTWQKLPKYRVELRSHDKELFVLQWAASADHIQSRLERAGWLAPPAWSTRTTLLWLIPSTAAKELPVLPRYNLGKGSGLAFVLLDPGKPLSRTVLRIWRSDYLLEKSDREPPVPIWYGAFYQEDFKQPGHLFTLGITGNFTDVPALMRLLPADLKILLRPASENIPKRQTILALPATPAPS
jgi:membrane protein DedA with SNARE-associated domain/membrane-associated phospholipid phosphatase